MGKNKNINTNIDEKSGVALPQITDLIKEPHHNYYAVMEFRTEQQLGLSNNPNSYVNTINHFFHNGVETMRFFLHTNNSNTIIATGDTMEELKRDMIKQTKLFNVIKK